MPSDPQPVDAVGDLAVLTRLLDSRTEVSVSQRDAVSIAARGIDNLSCWHGSVRVDPVAPTTTKRGGQVGDFLAVAVSRCWRELPHSEATALYANFF